MARPRERGHSITIVKIEQRRRREYRECVWCKWERTERRRGWEDKGKGETSLNLEIEHSEKIKTFHEDQDLGVVVFAFKCKSAGIGLSYFYPCSRYSSLLLLVSDFNMGNGSKEKVRACFIGLFCFYEVFGL